jgi:hypothetical protein
MEENKITEPTNMEEEETTNFAVVLPIKLPPELKKKMAAEIQNITMQTLASHHLLEEEEISTADAESMAIGPIEPPTDAPKSLKFLWKNKWMGIAPKKDLFKF